MWECKRSRTGSTETWYRRGWRRDSPGLSAGSEAPLSRWLGRRDRNKDASWRSLGEPKGLSLRERLQGRAFVSDQLSDLLHEVGREHVFRLLFRAGSDIDFSSLGLLVSDHQQEWNFLHGV